MDHCRCLLMKEEVEKNATPVVLLSVSFADQRCDAVPLLKIKAGVPTNSCIISWWYDGICCCISQLDSVLRASLWQAFLYMCRTTVWSINNEEEDLWCFWCGRTSVISRDPVRWESLRSQASPSFFPMFSSMLLSLPTMINCLLSACRNYRRRRSLEASNAATTAMIWYRTGWRAANSQRLRRQQGLGCSNGNGRLPENSQRLSISDGNRRQSQ